MNPGAHDHSPDRVEGGASQPTVPAVTVNNGLQQWDQSFGILHSTDPVGKTLAQSPIKQVVVYHSLPASRSVSGPGDKQLLEKTPDWRKQGSGV